MNDTKQEETAQEYADRLGLETVGEVKREFKHLEGRSTTEKNMILKNDLGLVVDDTGALRDSETGEAMKEGGLYVEES